MEKKFGLLTFLSLLKCSAMDAVSEYHCTGGTQILLKHVCNGYAHCPDGSDETKHLCVHTVCDQSMFRCEYGACIEKEMKCNGMQDCADNSDENYCGHIHGSCNFTEFHCDTGECIKQKLLCDGKADCLDNSDETRLTCNNFPCPKYTFRCNSGACIPKTKVCDGINHCVDGSDEFCKTNKCSFREFLCRSGECISRRFLCDGQVNCFDGSDETTVECSNTVCPFHTYQCDYGACVTKSSRRNGIIDCTDASDELMTLPEDKCRLPLPSSHVRYKVIGCHNCQPGALVNQTQMLEYSCDVGHSIHGRSKVYCNGNEWVPQLPICIPGSSEITCAAPDFSRLSVTCESRYGTSQGWVPCDRPLPVGTVIQYQCLPYYQPVGQQEQNNTQSMCQKDGTWSRKILDCKPECGHQGVEVNPLVVNGSASGYGVWPWVASLYSLQSGVWTFWCGGSLVNEYAVVTAAHCVWKSTPNTTRVAVGKFHRDYDSKQELTQIRGVSNIVIQPAYQDQGGNYGSDLAVLILDSPATFSSVVKPICIDWDGLHTQTDLTSGNLGVVAGWGINENDTFSESLRMTRLPVITNEYCIDVQVKDFKKYVTHTSFCAGFANGTGVCNGDSGGGLVFPRTNSSDGYVLQGIVSISPRRRGTAFCDPYSYTVFTKVAMYTKWLHSILQPLEPNPNIDIHSDISNEDHLIRNI